MNTPFKRDRVNAQNPIISYTHIKPPSGGAAEYVYDKVYAYPPASMFGAGVPTIPSYRAVPLPGSQLRATFIVYDNSLSGAGVVAGGIRAQPLVNTDPNGE